METKLCKKCGRTLPVSEFNKNKQSKDGLHCYCRECHNAMTHASYLKRKAKANIEKHDTIINTSTTNPDLKNFHPRELIAELQARGYRGKLYITREVIV